MNALRLFNMTRRHFFLIALIPLLMLSAWHFLSPGRQLKAAQNRFLEAVSSKDAKACARLIHPDYTDQWGFSPSDWPALLQDLRLLSPILELELINPVIDAANGVVETSIKAKSAGGPAADVIDARAVELKETTRFTWKREPWKPWSWQLINIQNPDLGIPQGYQPGKLSGLPQL